MSEAADVMDYSARQGDYSGWARKCADTYALAMLLKAFLLSDADGGSTAADTARKIDEAPARKTSRRHSSACWN